MALELVLLSFLSVAATNQTIAGPTDKGLRNELVRNIYGAAHDPFTVFTSPKGLSKRASPHTHVTSSLIEHLLTVTDARFVVEVGAFIGGSTVLLAKAIDKRRKLIGKADGALVSIDPFVGDVQMWFNVLGPPRLGRKFISGRPDTNPAHDRFLFMQNGRPRIFEQFMVNVLEEKMQHIVLPLATTATVGLVGLQRLQSVRGIPQVDALYLDSSHEEEDTLAELKLAWAVLRPGGVIFGDDYDQYWPGVQGAVYAFAAMKSTQLEWQSDEGMQAIPPHNWTQIMPGLLVDTVHTKGNQWILFSRRKPHEVV